MKRFLLVVLFIFNISVFANTDWLSAVIPPHAIYVKSATTEPYWEVVDYPYLDAPAHMNNLRYLGKTNMDHTGYQIKFIVRVPNEIFQPLQARGKIGTPKVRYAYLGDELQCVHHSYDHQNNRLLECVDPYFDGESSYEIFFSVNLGTSGTANVFSFLTVR